MATESLTDRRTVAAAQPQTGLFVGRRGRILRENLVAYLFLAPAAVVIFIFQVFPIIYAAYVSLYKWRIRQDEYVGLQNFIDAMGPPAYVFFLLVVLALLVMAGRTAWQTIKIARAGDFPSHYPLLALAPAAITVYGILQITLRFVTFFAQERAIEAGEAARLGSIPLGLAFLFVGTLAGWLLTHWQHQERHTAAAFNFVTPAVSFLMTLGLAVALAIFTYGHLQDIPNTEATAALIRARFLLQSLVYFGLAYALWSWAMRQHSNLKLIGGILGAAALIGAAVYLFNIWPAVSVDSDPDFYESMKVTVWYSIGTVPIQLVIALVLAYLLFQDIRGKAFFRIVFFIPYIAPSVATAAIFQLLFSIREGSLANQALQLFGTDATLQWLKEPSSVFAELGQAFGISAAANWEAGPSLALAVIILYNIWVFVGYDTVIFLAGLGNIPGVLYEAAKIDGAGRWALFRHITLPLLSPTTFFLSVISIIGTFKAFNHIWILRDNAALGTTDTSSIYFFEVFFRGSRFGYATAMAMVLFAVILALTAMQNQIAARRVFYG
jgi:ABC-type sugar transport system permease subunit